MLSRHANAVRLLSTGSLGMDYRRYYDLESYLLHTVRPRFQKQGCLSAADFFCIVIWKANRAKSKIAKKLLKHHPGNLDGAVRALTGGLAKQSTPKERLRFLFEDWEFSLPMASAILTVLYPDEFTMYDWRVCGALGDDKRDFHRLGNIANFERLWEGYQAFKRAVEEAGPDGLTLREKDRYLWGKSFHDQLISDVERGFKKD